MGFPENLRRRRLELGVTQAQLSDLIHIDLRQIVRYEQGEAQPALKVAVAIARVLDISLDELVREQPTPGA